MTMNAPWTQKNDLAPVYGADGRLISFTEHAAQIVKSVNFRHFAEPMMGRVVKIIEKATGPSAEADDTESLRAAAVQMRQILDAMQAPLAAE